MKTKILGGIFALVVMVAVGYGVNKSVQNNADLSDMALSNVEAFADENVNPDCPNGCIIDDVNCHCYGIHPHYGEYDWDKAK
ncbi:NVEALA domain-containing protein [Tannerella forsythia]